MIKPILKFFFMCKFFINYFYRIFIKNGCLGTWYNIVPATVLTKL